MFSFLLLVTITLTSFLLIRSGNRIVDDVIAETAQTISRDLSREVTRLLETPDIVNINGARSIQAGRIDYTDDDSISRFFMDAPQRRAEYSVSSIYFAEPSGRFIGVEIGGHRQALDSWDISISSYRTNGIYTDFEANPDGTVGAKIGEVKPYDPRVRPWYISALATPERAIWTDVYTDFNTGLATLTRAQAVLDGNDNLIGVVAVDLFLEHIQTFLSTLEMSENSEAFIVNANGLVLAAHAPAYTGELPSHNLKVAESPFQFLPSAVGEIGKLQHTPDGENYIFTRGRDYAETTNLNGKEGYLYSAAIGKQHGVDWTLGVFIPNSDFLQSVNEQMFKLVPLALVGLLLVGAALRLFLSVVIRPLEELRENANRIAAGNFNTDIDTSMGNEVGELARSIDSMQKSLSSTFTKLEDNVQELSKEKSRAVSTLSSISDGVVSIDRDQRVVYMNPAAQLLTGWEMNEVHLQRTSQVINIQYIDKSSRINHKELDHLLSSSDETEIEGLELMDRSGDTRPISFKVSPTTSDNGTSYGSVITFSDLTEKLLMTNELVHQATHDDLTGLVNRREFERLLELSLQVDRKATDTDTLLYLDLDQFKIVNDSCGHLAGDELLRQIAKNFEQCVRAGDVVARLGGDEFGILLRHCPLDQGILIAEKIIAGLEKFRFDWEQRSFRIGVSIGLLSIDSSNLSVGAVLSDVDSACYLAKEAGRNRIHLFAENDESIKKKRDELQWVDRIEQAIELGSFVLYAQKIQPTRNYSESRPHFEVLVRMIEDNGEFIPPGAFLPAAERYNLTTKIDQWVIENTFRWLAGNREFLSSLGVCFINMSGQSISDSSVSPFVLELLNRYKIPADQICFEVTETATIANLSTAIRIIDTLRERGCLFALDDFGTGLSSFEYLKNLNVDFIKIDGIFVRDIIANKYDQAIVNAINEIGKTLGLLTVAEFVETQELIEQLEEIGVDFVQGYGVCRPQPINEMLSVPFQRSA